MGTSNGKSRGTGDGQLDVTALYRAAKELAERCETLRNDAHAIMETTWQRFQRKWDAESSQDYSAAFAAWREAETALQMARENLTACEVLLAGRDRQN